MCGRNTIFSDKNKIKEELKTNTWKDEEDFNPTYNLSPTQNSPVLVKNNKRVIYSMRWGFGFKKNSKPIFNARSETLDIKPSFKDLIAKNRCIVISNGFFEWKKRDDIKIPYFIHESDGKVIAMAGLCKWDTDMKGNRKLVYTIITKKARESLKEIHHREPVMLNDRSVSAWINVNDPCDDPLAILNDNSDRISSYEVSKFVNKSSNDSAECIQKKILG